MTNSCLSIYDKGQTIQLGRPHGSTSAVTEFHGLMVYNEKSTPKPLSCMLGYHKSTEGGFLSLHGKSGDFIYPQ